ncbi:PAS domain-containing protein [Alcaligenaceae bacterium]|nr:PAS domain-containing protein [Alcaligenaceae bacterium]
MRDNRPVTQQEHDFADDATLMSTTDHEGYITYANEAFNEVSGFSPQDLLGQPHNIVRHPDMPREAFADMWTTLKQGEPWTALVKNRRSNGDHYWVRANAVPIIRDGVNEGYMSVRTKPSRREIEQFEPLYLAMSRRQASGRRLYKGVLLRTGPGILLDMFKVLSVRGRIRLNVGLLWLALMAGLFLFGGDPAQTAATASLASALSAILCLALERQLARPLELLRRRALDVATGNNRNVMNLDRVDEIGMTMRTISQLGLMFRWLVDDVSEQAVAVRTAVNSIARGNQDLDVRTEQASASIESTASAMEEMIATVQNNAETAEQANVLSGAASRAAERGGEAMAQIVATMQDISTDSRRIMDIIGIIDEIAFQTNFLALNAAVEAARAGAQGRGFAVVASEVRALAQRSAASAQEIKTLIEASATKIEAGSRMVDEAGQVIDRIVAQAQQVSSLIAEISTATREQSEGIGQIGQVVTHMDHLTQQNASLVKRSAAASADLDWQAGQLVEAVRVFR